MTVLAMFPFCLVPVQRSLAESKRKHAVIVPPRLSQMGPLTQMSPTMHYKGILIEK